MATSGCPESQSDRQTVTIVIPCYKQEGTLEAAILSAMRSDKAERHIDQIIVVNDASPSAQMLPEIVSHCEALGTCPIKLFNLRERRGLSHARNIGFGAARSRWVLPLDADDELTPGGLGVLVSRATASDVKLNGGPGPKVGFVYGDWIGFCSNWQAGRRNYATTQVGVLDWYALERKPLLPYMALINKRAWAAVRKVNGTGYDEKVLGFEDWLFWLELVSCGWNPAYAASPQPVWKYRIYENGSGMRRASWKQFRQIAEYVRKKIRDLYGYVARVDRPSNG